MTGGPARLIEAQIAFGRLDDRLFGVLVDDETPVLVADFDHTDVIVGAICGAGGATDAGIVVDHHLPALGIAVDGAGRAPNHANRIDAMHARVGDHVVFECPAVADETRIVVMALGAGLDAGVAAHAAVEVDKHGRGAHDEAVFD